MAGIPKRGAKDRMDLIQQELDRLLSEYLPRQRSNQYAGIDRRPEVRVDVFETDESLCIRAEVPGLEKDEVEVYLSRDLLVIEGQKRMPISGENVRFLNLEREFGSIKREIGIPKPIDANKSTAHLIGGVLHVEMPKISDRRGKRRRIPVE